jgi:hypothetical protein
MLQPSIYRVKFTADAILQSAVDKRGQTVKESVINGQDSGVFTCRMVRGRWANEAVLKTLGQELLLRKELAQLICDRLRLPDGLWWHDAIVLSGTDQQLGDYRLVDPNRIEYDIADREASDLKIVFGAILQIRRLVADRTKVPDFDLFPMAPVDWVATEKARQLLVSANASGMAFEEVLVCEPDTNRPNR